MEQKKKKKKGEILLFTSRVLVVFGGVAGKINLNGMDNFKVLGDNDDDVI